ncbi:hypothetical protein J0H58_06240 [bacterium]|nr:hypothetical protein [bacterium]
MRVRSMALLLALGAGFLPGAVLAQPDPPALAAAKRRQTAAGSLTVDFQRTEKAAKGAVTIGLLSAPGERPFPDEETTLTSDNRLRFFGNKYRYERNHPVWAPDERKVLPVRLINVWDGTTDKSFYPSGLSEKASEGTVYRDRRSRDIRDVVLVPLLLAFRGADPALSPYPAADLEATADTEVVSGQKCQVFRHPRHPNLRLWLDPAADSLVRRIRWTAKGKTTGEAVVYPVRDPTCGWRPGGWTHTQYAPDGAVLFTHVVRVTAVNYTSPLPDDFALTFPPGTVVTDATNGKLFRVGPGGVWSELPR